MSKMVESEISDNGIKIGDLITAYKKGYWVVTSITRRYRDSLELESVIHAKRIMTAKFKKSRGTDWCDSAWCKVVDRKEFEKNIREQAKALMKECDDLFEEYGKEKDNG